MKRLSNNDLFKRLQKVANEYNESHPDKDDISLTYSTKIFYIKVLDYALEHGEETERGFSVDLSVKEMAKIGGVSDGMSEKAIKTLSESGIILRNKITSKKVITILERSVFEA